MHGRNLTGSIANLFPLDVFIRDNRHAYDAFIYGFQQEKSLSAEIMMTLQTTVELRMLFFLRSQQIHNTINAEILSSLFKYIRAEIYNTINVKVDYRLLKYIRKEIVNSLSTLVTVSLKKILSPSDLPFGFIIGTIDRGKVIADIENYFISDIEDLTIYELCEGLTGTRHGLRIGLVRPLRISDIENFTVAQIQNRTIEDICFVRIH